MKKDGRFLLAWLPISLASLILCSSCSYVPLFTKKLSGNRAFIVYWPPDPNNPGLRLAAKDNIDVKGVLTTAGSEYFSKTHEPAEADATCLALARQRGVQIVGKTNLTEFAVAPSGLNEYFGNPQNPLKRRLIPGGSSSGSAVAVAAGMADVALGTDTAGSIRVPAACCGVVGLKTTHGLISLKGIHPIEPAHLDTVGPMGKDIAHTAMGMDLLQDGFAARYAAAQAAKPTGQTIRVGRLKLRNTDPKIDEAIDNALLKAGFQIVPMPDSLREKWDRAKADGNTVAAAGAWKSDKQYRYALGVSGRTKSVIRAGEVASITAYGGAIARQSAWQDTLRSVFENVDFVAVPTVQSTPPVIPPNLKIGLLEAWMLNFQNTVAVNFAGNPALAMPVPLHGANIPVASLQLIGPRNSEAELLNAGRLVESAVQE